VAYRGGSHDNGEDDPTLLVAGSQAASYARTVPEREEVAVPVVLVHEGVTQEQYEESVRKLAGKERMESPADWPVPGLLAHIPGQGEKGFRVVDVWESQEALDAFAAKLMPILEEIGVQGRPEVYPAHTYVSA
jgi:hypothetical protein